MVITKEFQNRTYDQFRNKIILENKEVYNLYCRNYEKLRMDHVIYKSGWHCSFFDDHRYMNWIIYSLICENFGKSVTILDLGCYDGVLVKCLYSRGYNVYGFDQFGWGDLWQTIGINHRINVKIKEPVKIVVMFNYHHTFKPDDLFGFIKERCNGRLPEFAFFDRETTAKHPCNILYYDPRVLRKLDISVVTFDTADQYSEKTIRDLMIWLKKD